MVTHSAPPRHIVGLDLLRLFAAMAVVLFHLAYLDWALPGSTTHQMSGGLAEFRELSAISGFGWVGVQIFFVISGFVIASTSMAATPWSFLRSRAVRLLPAAWVCASLSFIAGRLFLSGTMSIRAYLDSITLSPLGPWVDPSYWTLGVEISFYAMVGILIASGHIERLRQLGLLVGSVSAAYWLLRILAFSNPGHALAPLLDQTRESRALELMLVHHGCFFCLGVCLWWHHFRRASFANMLACGFMAAICVVQILFQHMLVIEKTGQAASGAIPVVVWLIAVAAIVVSIRINDLLHRYVTLRLCAKKIGLATYPLYLVHQVLGCLLLGQLIAFGCNRFLALAVSVCAIFGLSMVIASQLEQPFKALLERGLLMLRGLAFSRPA